MGIVELLNGVVLQRPVKVDEIFFSIALSYSLIHLETDYYGVWRGQGCTQTILRMQGLSLYTLDIPLLNCSPVARAVSGK